MVLVWWWWRCGGFFHDHYLYVSNMNKTPNPQGHLKNSGTSGQISELERTSRAAASRNAGLPRKPAQAKESASRLS